MWLVMDFKQKLNVLKADFCSMDTVALSYKVINVLIHVMFVVCIIMAFSDVCFASDVFEAGKEIGKQVYKSIAGVSTVLAGVGIAIAACMYFFSPNERSVASAKTWMLNIVKAWVIINCVGLLLTTIKNLLGNYAGQGLN